ncbi:MAG: PAS domain S-box protein, partial [Synechococcaceae cyanobacterium]|nr:PAS domain S-box protein [Synechococcaceae cyanobacterium]
MEIRIGGAIGNVERLQRPLPFSFVRRQGTGLHDANMPPEASASVEGRAPLSRAVKTAAGDSGQKVSKLKCQWPYLAMKTIEDLRREPLPFILADHHGMIEEVNDHFQQVYGWTQQDLAGQSLSIILPAVFRDAHHLGFSRFQITQESQILNHPLHLKTVCRDGKAI